MCRLFGYRNITSEQVSSPMLDEDNAFSVQSREHRDGWGVAYFHRGIPHVIKSRFCAAEDDDFTNLARNLKAETVIAHLRRATQGQISLLNCHPFQFGGWVMAHNGDLPDFTDVREKLRQGIDAEILHGVHGNTDSEIYFALFLNELLKASALHTKPPTIKACAEALHRAIFRIESVYEHKDHKQPFALNVLIANSELLLAYRQGHELFFSAQTSPDAPNKMGKSIEPLDLGGKTVSRLIICSEPHSKQSAFLELKERQMIGIDHEFRLHLAL